MQLSCFEQRISAAAKARGIELEQNDCCVTLEKRMLLILICDNCCVDLGGQLSTELSAHSTIMHPNSTCVLTHLHLHAPHPI